MKLIPSMCVHADNSADVTALDAVHIGLSEAVEDHQLFDLVLFDHIIAFAETNLLACPEDAAGQLSDSDTADIR